MLIPRSALKNLTGLLATAFILWTGATALAFEHPRYDIQAALDDERKVIKAVQVVDFFNNTTLPADHLVFHIYPNRKFTRKEKDFMMRYAGFFKVNAFPEGFDSGSIAFSKVQHDGEDLNFRVAGEDKTLLYVDLPQPLNPGDRISVVMDFEVRVPHAYGRFGWNDGITALSRWYPILAVLTDEGWQAPPFYPFHRPFFSDAADYHVTLNVPADQTVIHSGLNVSDQTQGDRKILEIQSEHPIREFTLALSSRYEVVEKEWDGITLRVYHLPDHKERALWALQDAQDMMAYYTQRFGPYPYKEFSIAPVYLAYGGEQMANMVFIDTRVFELPKILSRYLDFLIAHETGHQWFFNTVGINEFQEMWLEEGIHSYFLLGHLEAKYGEDATVVDLKKLPKLIDWLLPEFTFERARTARYKMIARQGYDKPIVDKLSSFQEPSSIFSLTYGKGSSVVGMLREVVGEEAFDRIFRRIFSEYQFRNLSLKDFIRLCEEESGQDLQWFFDQWLHQAVQLDQAIEAVHDGVIKLSNRKEARMPTKVEVVYTDGEKQIVSWDGTSEQINIATGKIVKSVRIDPDEGLLDIDLTNNSWPRVLNIQPVPLYHPLWEIPALMPDDAYNLIVGPTIGGALGLKASLQKPYDQQLYAGTDYDLNEQLHRSRVGYLLNNVGQTQMALGAEVENTTDHDNGEEDLVSGKVFLRRELWPAPYGLFDINDHATLYMVRNRGLNGSFTTGEDVRNISYRRKDESIVGAALDLNRSAPYPDPHQGFKAHAFAESSGHFLGATQYFYRSALDTSFYHRVTARSKLAWRLKYGWGSPDDKSLFELGGINGLRGFDRKDIRGANAAMGSAEYRFPMVENVDIKILDNLIGVSAVSGVVFYDAGQAWYQSFEDSRLRKDAGAGVRVTMDIGSFVEQMILGIDVAQAINEPNEDDPHVWFSVNHAF